MCGQGWGEQRCGEPGGRHGQTGGVTTLLICSGREIQPGEITVGLVMILYTIYSRQ